MCTLIRCNDSKMRPDAIQYMIRTQQSRADTAELRFETTTCAQWTNFTHRVTEKPALFSAAKMAGVAARSGA